ncbi:adenylate cyclase [Schistosoma japonicum]|nr:adenylate cyclase [Schistosoma japonicum]KAH8866298.1 adenylate cyclase [Schistosoma japonicum]KAH8866299.1 adenylate cyclase [Schistosoma japonicum]
MKMCISSETKAIFNYKVLTFFTFVSVTMSFFISDQFVYFSCLSEQGIDYWSVDKNGSVTGLQDAQKKAAFIQSVKNFLGIGTGIFSTLVVGYLSDKYGRRLTLGIIVFGEALRILVISIVVFFNLSPWSLIVSELLEGSIGGGLLSISAQIAACLADLTQNSQNNNIVSNENMDMETRTKRLIKERWLLFTLLDGVVSCGMALANALAGYMIQHYRFYITMLTCIIFLIPLPISLLLTSEKSVKIIQVAEPDVENLSHELSDTTSVIQNKSGELQEFPNSSYSIHVKSGNSCMNKLRIVSNLPLTHLIIVSLVFMFSISGITDVQYLFLYLMSNPFLWDAQAVGLFIGVRDVCCTFMSVFCVSMVVKFRKNQPDNHIEVTTSDGATSNRINTTLFNRFKSVDQILLMVLVFFGFLLLSIHQILMGLASTLTVPSANIFIYFATIPRCVKGFQLPILRTMISKWTEVSKQGMVMSVVGVVERLGILISIGALPVIYASTISSFKGSVFLVCASLTIMEAMIVLFLPVYAPKLSSS